MVLSLTGCGDGSGGGGGGEKAPEEKTTAERWGKWVDPSSTATLDYSVAGNGKCTITVGGKAESDRWKASARYSYTAKKDKLYDYTFEAWTQSGDRELTIQYYEDNDERVYLWDIVSLTTTQKTFTVNGTNIPKSGIQPLAFQCADQTGTFYVKVLTISEYDDSFGELRKWLSTQPANTPNTAYTIELKIDNVRDFATIKTMLDKNSNKYVYLDLSGSTITEIPENAFAYCNNLTGVTIPNSVTSIGDGAFWECYSLTSINVDAGNSAYTSEDGVLYNKNKTALILYPGGKTGNTFTIPSSVTSIESYAFQDCTSLTSINVDAGNSAYTSEDGVLYNKAKTLLHRYPAGKTGTSFTIPNSVTDIEYNAFYYCTSLTSVTIPNSITSIGFCAFQGFIGLTSITIPNNVISIERSAFNACASLASVTIGSGVTSIGEHAFWQCDSLTSVTFQGTITSDNFGSYDDAEDVDITSPFDGDLREKYLAGGIGTYTRASGGAVWTKQ
jgi:hypothetical protein